MSVIPHYFFRMFCTLAGAAFLLGATPPASAYEGTAGSGGNSIQGIWFQYGGARLQYNALVAPRQVNTGGTALSDPAQLPLLQPLKPWTAAKQPRKRAVRRAAPKPQPAAVTTLRNATPPKGVTLTPVPMPAATPAPTVGPSPVPVAEPQPMAVPGVPAVPTH